VIVVLLYICCILLILHCYLLYIPQFRIVLVGYPCYYPLLLFIYILLLPTFGLLLLCVFFSGWCVTRLPSYRTLCWFLTRYTVHTDLNTTQLFPACTPIRRFATTTSRHSRCYRVTIVPTRRDSAVTFGSCHADYIAFPTRYWWIHLSAHPLYDFALPAPRVRSHTCRVRLRTTRPTFWTRCAPLRALRFLPRVSHVLHNRCRASPTRGLQRVRTTAPRGDLPFTTTLPAVWLLYARPLDAALRLSTSPASALPGTGYFYVSPRFAVWFTLARLLRCRL